MASNFKNTLTGLKNVLAGAVGKRVPQTIQTSEYRRVCNWINLVTEKCEFIRTCNRRSEYQAWAASVIQTVLSGCWAAATSTQHRSNRKYAFLAPACSWYLLHNHRNEHLQYENRHDSRPECIPSGSKLIWYTRRLVWLHRSSQFEFEHAEQCAKSFRKHGQIHAIQYAGWWSQQ